MAECGDTIRWEWRSGSFHQGTCTDEPGHEGRCSMTGRSTDKKSFTLYWDSLEGAEVAVPAIPKRPSPAVGRVA